MNQLRNEDDVLASVTNDRLTRNDLVESLRRGKRRRGVGFRQRGILDRRHGHLHGAARNGGATTADVYLRRGVCVQGVTDFPAAREVEIPALADPHVVMDSQRAATEIDDRSLKSKYSVPGCRSERTANARGRCRRGRGRRTTESVWRKRDVDGVEPY